MLSQAPSQNGHSNVSMFVGVHGILPPYSTIFFRMNKNKTEWAEVPAWGQLLYNHVILKLVLSLPIAKVLTIFLHIQNAIPRIRIPRHGASSQLQLPYRHETDMSKWIQPVRSHHTKFRVMKDTSKWWAPGKQEQNKSVLQLGRVPGQGPKQEARSAHIALFKMVEVKVNGKLVARLWVSNLAIPSVLTCSQRYPALFSGMPWSNSPESEYHPSTYIATAEQLDLITRNLLNVHPKLDSNHAHWSWYCPSSVLGGPKRVLWKTVIAAFGGWGMTVKLRLVWTTEQGLSPRPKIYHG